MAEFFGDLERLAADAYPYRWPIIAAVAVLLAGAVYYAHRIGLHLLLWRRRVAAAIIGTPLLVLFGFISYDLGSPLFINKTVEEEFPFAYAAEVPPGMEMADVEMVMEGMANVVSTVDENMPRMAPGAGSTDGSAAALKSGMFRDADSFHKGSGVATVYRTPDGSHLLRLEDLDVTNGPDLRVLLVRHHDPTHRDQVRDQGYVELDKLKGNRGSQNYPIPDGEDPAGYNSVVIYCAPFHVIFSVAPLVDVSG